MNLWRLATLFLLTIALASVWAVYDTTQRLAQALYANRVLSQELVDGDAGVEMIVHPRTGDVLVRINGAHVHQFTGACAKVRL